MEPGSTKGKEREQKEKEKDDDDVDVLDVFSDHFDPLRAIYDDRGFVPGEEVKVEDNVEKLAAMLEGRKNWEIISGTGRGDWQYMVDGAKQRVTEEL